MSNTLTTREKLDDLYTLKIGLSNVQWIVQMHRINEEGQKYVNILISNYLFYARNENIKISETAQRNRL